MSIPTFELKQVSFCYEAGFEGSGIEDVTLRGYPGEVILLAGESGSGKTTVTKLLNGLIPHHNKGFVSGTVEVCGLSVPDTPLYQISQRVGSVFQNPRSQFFTTDTTSELAFSCENQGIPKEEIFRRIDKVVGELSIVDLLDRNIFHLSGGERQRLACAAASTIEPVLYILDEPSSNLDMAGIERLRCSIEIWKRAGKTVIIAEHRIHYLRYLVDRVVIMRDGRIDQQFSGEKFRSLNASDLRLMGLRVSVLEKEEAPASVNVRHVSEGPVVSLAPDETPVVIRNVHLTYPHCSYPTVSIDHLELSRTGIVALIGKNGAGKSSFLLCLSGLMPHTKTSLLLDGVVCEGRKLTKVSYLVMQDVNHQLFAESVFDEVLLNSSKPTENEALGALEALNVKFLRDRHPLSLSGGQKQRVALAAAVVAKRKVIIYDEPTSGLDLRHMENVADVMRKMRERGLLQIVATHDPELIESCCTDVVVLDQGRVLSAYPLDEAGIHRMYDFFRNQKSLN